MDNSNGPDRPHRSAKQARSQFTMQAIREAALLLLAEERVEALTTNKVAERAGVGIASLYHYYPNKEAILSDIYEHKLEQLDLKLRDTMGQVDSSAPIKQQIHYALNFAMDYSEELAALHNGFYRAYRQSFDITTRPGPKGEGTWGLWSNVWFHELLIRHCEQLRVDDLQAATQLIVDTCTGYIYRVIETRPDDEGQAEKMNALTDMICRYLLKPEFVDKT